MRLCGGGLSWVFRRWHKARVSTKWCGVTAARLALVVRQSFYVNITSCETQHGNVTLAAASAEQQTRRKWRRGMERDGVSREWQQWNCFVKHFRNELFLFLFSFSLAIIFAEIITYYYYYYSHTRFFLCIVYRTKPATAVFFHNVRQYHIHSILEDVYIGAGIPPFSGAKNMSIKKNAL